MKTYWVYMVLCADASYYIGITNDVERRLGEHNFGIDPHCYTYTRRPVQLVYVAEFSDPSDAIRWEKQIKNWSRKKKEALVAGNYEQLKQLAKAGSHK
jgi:putative endonuclease